MVIMGVALVVCAVLYLTTGFLSFMQPGAAPQGDGSESGGTLYINEIMPRNSGAVPDEVGDFADWIEIYNAGSEAVELNGYGISDDPNELAKWIFPDMTIGPDEYLVIFCSDKDIRDGEAPYLHTNFKLKSGETAALVHASGDIIDRVAIVEVESNKSYGHDVENAGEWVIFDAPTPGYANTTAGRQQYVDSMDASGLGVILNEIMPSNKTTYADENGAYSDWIELYNATAAPVDLSGFGLSDDPLKPLKWKFPEGITLGPNEYLVVFCSGALNISNGDELHASFKLAAYEETVTLCNRRGQKVDEVSYQEMAADVAYARTETGWDISGRPTPGYANTDEGFAEFQTRFAFAPTGLMVSEVMSSNAVFVQAEDNQYYDWVELHNPTGSDINLLNYALSDNTGNPAKWKFPEVTINAGEYMVVLCSGNDVTDTKKNVRNQFCA